MISQLMLLWISKFCAQLTQQLLVDYEVYNYNN